MIRPPHKQLTVLACVLVLSACSGKDFSDLDAFMAEKRARPGGIIAPIPTFKLTVKVQAPAADKDDSGKG